MRYLSDILLGKEKTTWSLFELSGESECCIEKHIFKQISPQDLQQANIAYLDPFGHLSDHLSDNLLAHPIALSDLLILKPEGFEEAAKMLDFLSENSNIDIIIADSLFWLPGSYKNFERTLSHMAKRSHIHQKPIWLLNPDNAARKWLETSLSTFCVKQIRVF